MNYIGIVFLLSAAYILYFSTTSQDTKNERFGIINGQYVDIAKPDDKQSMTVSQILSSPSDSKKSRGEKTALYTSKYRMNSGINFY